MDRRIVEGRLQSGVHLFAPKGKDGTRELIEALKAGEILGFLNYQRVNRGVEAPFFGSMVRTAPGPVRLALSNDAVVVPVAVRRLPGVRFEAEAFPPMELERTGDRTADLAAGVARINAFMEAQIRRRPEQWLWSHRRWPVEVYAKAKGRRR
jgi:KDO2-lipid IV(A) lauroyltransferase